MFTFTFKALAYGLFTWTFYKVKLVTQVVQVEVNIHRSLQENKKNKSHTAFGFYVFIKDKKAGIGLATVMFVKSILLHVV